MRQTGMHLRAGWFVLLLILGVRLNADFSVRTNLFVSGEGGYPMYRIPAVTVTTQGTLLAVCEARTRRDSDWSQTDLLFRRSEDGGRTWSAPAKVVQAPADLTRSPVALAQRLGREDERTLHNPVFIADRDGTVHLLFGAEYNRVFYTRSRDDGRTFEAPRELTSVAEAWRSQYDWKVIATGPGHGLQLSAGRPDRTNALAGRLVVPVWLSLGTGGHGHRPSAIATLISDDHGLTWKTGDLIANDPEPLANPSEATLAELADGRVMLNIRNESKNHRRAVAVSPDGARGWSRPQFDEALFEPICAASLIRLPGPPRERAATLVFVNPDSQFPATNAGAATGARRNLTVRLSADDGRTWPVQRVLDAGPSGYSDLAPGSDGSIWCLYESSPGTSLGYAALTLVRLDLDWIFGEDTRIGDTGFVDLFDGQSLKGWVNVNCAPETWTATNGVIACTGAPIGELRTERMYQNFIAELEWRHLKPKGNAGVFVWADALTARGQPFHRGVEVQVLDGLESDWYTSDGDVFPIHGARLTPLNGRGGDRAYPVTKRMKPSPEWNHYRITCVDGVLTHAVNGAVVTRGVSATPRKGYLCLESEGSPVEFRRLRIKELPAATALAPADIALFEENFHSLYTGLDLRGWRAPSGSPAWTPNDWILEHAGTTDPVAGILWSEASHGDFELIVDWSYPKGATNFAPCVLHLRGGSTGSISLPAGRPDEWSRARVSLRGNQLSVTINGQAVQTQVTLPDLSPIGWIGLQPTSRPVAFANLFLRRLD